MNEIIERFEEIRVIPVVAIERAEDSEPLADALIEGGFPCAEITFQTAADAVRAMSKRDDILVGAGTVLTSDQVKIARETGTVTR